MYASNKLWLPQPESTGLSGTGQYLDSWIFTLLSKYKCRMTHNVQCNYFMFQIETTVIGFTQNTSCCKSGSKSLWSVLGIDMIAEIKRMSLIKDGPISWAMKLSIQLSSPYCLHYASLGIPFIQFNRNFVAVGIYLDVTCISGITLFQLVTTKLNMFVDLGIGIIKPLFSLSKAR